MAGETSQSEVTRESYPLLFELQDELKARGIKSEPRAFDQYQGPYLYVPGAPCRVWYDSDDEAGETVLIERRLLEFETKGAHFVRNGTERTVRCGVYLPYQAAKRIAQMVR